MLRVGKIFKYGFVGAVCLSVYNSKDLDFKNIGIVRFARAGLTACSMTYLYKTTIYATDLDPKSEEYLKMKSEVHTRAASKLLDLCRANKGIFIKMGQHLGALDYLLPPEYIAVMKVLHSDAPTSPISEIYEVIRQELKQEPSDLFVEFDETPLGTASLAQVHKAKLKDGRTVAVKVQHPTVKAHSFVDLKTMEFLVRTAALIFPELKFNWLVVQSKQNIPRELDFALELQTTRKVKNMFKAFPWLTIPEVYEELSSPRVLTMEYVEGGQINDLAYMKDQQIDCYDVSDKLGKLYSEMIFKKGFVHSDPHPGNILVKKHADGSVKLILLDHGLYQTLSDSVKMEYSQLWMAILSKNLNGIKAHCEALGVGRLYGLFACMVTGRSWNAITDGITITKKTTEEVDLIKDSFPMLLSQMMNALESVNEELLLILKTNDLLRGVEHTLKTQNR